MDTQAVDSPNAVAVIGMSGRFPGARNLDQFWQNLAGGVESIVFFSDEELLAAGVPIELIYNREYVKAAPVLEDVDLFDARFFQFSPREASITDPQHRLFLECAWEALENAGYCGDTYAGSIGVFAGTGPSMSSYLSSETHVNPTLFGPSGSREHIGNDKDYLCTRVSYKLNLRGPSINVQTACSTSLVATHLACQSLLLGESDMALAGGVTARVPQSKGHLIRDNAMASHDGHCRPFDAEASGTVFGSGVGVIVLKRLADALADRDPIHAVIRGSAVNNDGTSKISFWASSAEGQMPAMVEAMAVAEVSPESIEFVEAHGTATALGDPVEILALTKAFRTGTEKSGYCAIGSVKSNVGHLDSASGIAGLIKAILALKHRALPPSLHFRQSNPRIDFPSSPFYVCTQLQPWEAGERPRRAAVNSLGIGGTNSFAVLEEAPAMAPMATSDADRPVHLLPLTAKLPRALQALVERYLEYLRANPQQRLADIAFTAATGRGQFPHRLSVIASSIDEARGLLEQFLAGETAAAGLVHGEVPRNALPKIAYLFSGELAASSSSFHLLYQTQPTFRREMERCAKVVLAHTGTLLLPSLFPQEAGGLEEGHRSSQALQALALNVSLAELLKTWGAAPVLVAGVQSGEFSAACAAGAMSLDDAVKILSADSDQRQHVGPSQPGAPPVIRIVSGTTGQPVTERVGEAEYWRSLDETSANPDAAVAALLEGKANVLLQIGGQNGVWDAGLGQLDSSKHVFLGGLPEGSCPWRHLLHQLAQMYVRGTPVGWKAFESDYPRRRLELPTYPFQRKRFWSDPAGVALSGKYGSRDPRLQEGMHPVLGRRIVMAHQPGHVLFETVVDTNSPLLGDETNPEETIDAPESFYQQTARAAAEVAGANGDVQFDGLETHAQLTLKPHRPRVVQLALFPEEANRFRFEVFSRDGETSAKPAAWTRHISARVVVG